ncbi:MAG: glycosyltransferase family 39 protein [Proteobacteria bacterium]|nr:glycosyltransferase family 39 protein [Pseudomonadota bacterium]
MTDISAAGPEGGSAHTLSARERLGLALLLLLAAALRVTWWHFGPQVIESEGINYARLGENLAAGRGLLGLNELGLELIYPPLYPLLIAAGIHAGLGAEYAGRLVSFVAGAGLPLACFWYGRRYASTAAGWLAGLVAAIHPLMIVLSAAVLTESAYLTLTLCGLYFMAEVLRLGRRRATLGAGVSLGLAYLLRPEAMVLTMALVLLLMLWNTRQWRQAAQRAAVLLAVFAVFAIPYVAFLWHETGQLRFEAKSAEGLLMAQSKVTGGEFYFGVDHNLAAYGASNTPDLARLKSEHVSVAQTAAVLARQSVRNLPNLLRALGSAQLGAPFLVALVALGLFATAWDGARLRSELPLLTALSLTLLTFCTWPFLHDRFLFPVMPALLVWTGAGLARMGLWARATTLALGGSRTVVRGAVLSAVAAPLALTVACAVSGVRASDELQESWADPMRRDDMMVGRWLHAQTRPVRIVDTTPTVAFYAGDVLVAYPWADSGTALRYLARQRVTFLILRDADRARRPYLPAWLASPPGNLVLQKSFGGAGGVTRVYRWRDTSPGQ